ncbi:MAG: hypothetical protein AAGA03_10580 [Planctomycetota bacterium]
MPGSEPPEATVRVPDSDPIQVALERRKAQIEASRRKLLQVLGQRAVNREPGAEARQRMERKTMEAASSLLELVPDSSLAVSVLSLPLVGVESPPPPAFDEGNSLPPELPTLTAETAPTYQIGRGWKLYREGSAASAVAVWTSVSQDASSLSHLAPRDRHQVAIRLIQDLIARSEVTDDQVDRLRYSLSTSATPSWHGAVVPILDLASAFAVGDSRLESSVDRERFLWHLAADDRPAIRALADGVPAETPQLTRAHLAWLQRQFDEIAPGESPANGALVRLIQLSDQVLRSTNPDSALEHDLLFSGMQRLLPSLDRGPDRIAQIPQDLSHESVPRFCQRFAHVISQPAMLGRYADRTKWLREIEIASAVTASATVDPAISARMIRQAIEASIQQIYEASDDRNSTKVIALLGRYQDRMLPAEGQIGDAEAIDRDYVIGRVSDQQGFATRDPSRQRELYRVSQESFQAIRRRIESLGDEGSAFYSDFGEATRCLAALQMRIAAGISAAKDADPLRQEAVTLARQAVLQPVAWHDDLDDRLHTLGIVLRNQASTSVNVGSPALLLSKSDQELRRAIERRKESGSSTAFLEMERLETLTMSIQTARSSESLSAKKAEVDPTSQADPASPYVDQAKSIRDRLAKPDPASGLRVLSDPLASTSLKGKWHQTIGRYHLIQQDFDLAKRHFETVWQLSQDSQWLPETAGQLAAINVSRCLVELTKREQDQTRQRRLATEAMEWPRRIKEPYPVIQMERVGQVLELAEISKEFSNVASATGEAESLYRDDPSDDRSGLLTRCALTMQRGLLLSSTLSPSSRAELRTGLNRLADTLAAPGSDHQPMLAIHREIVRACQSAAVEKRDDEALRRIVNALRLYDQAVPLSRPEDVRRALVQDWLLVATCQRLRMQGRSIQAATEALLQVRKEYPSVAELIDRLMGR